MNIQNFTTNMFYSLRFSFIFEGIPVEDMERENPVPEWFLDWWEKYGLSPLLIRPYALHTLRIPNFSPQSTMADVLYKTLRELVDVSNIDFLNGVRRCSHTRWFVMNHYKCRKIAQSTNYEEFHQ